MSVDHQTKKRILFEFCTNRKNRKAIASELSLDEETIGNIVSQYQAAESGVTVRRARMIDPFIPYITDKYRDFPNLAASVLWRECTERGYTGGQDHFRALVSSLKPRKKDRAYLRVETLQGEQAQVDWGLFGKIEVSPGFLRPLSCFVMVLSHSRRVFARFFLDQKQYTFQKAHNLAFQYFEGIPRKVLYDNLKSVIIKHTSEEILFNQDFMRFARQLSFEPVATNVRSPQEKGKVERAIRYIRESFFHGRTFSSIDDLNHQLETWLARVSDERHLHTDTSLTVKQAWALERQALRALPATFPEPCETLSAVVSKTCFVQYDSNYYSVPSKFVNENVVLNVSDDTICIFFSNVAIARHSRVWGRRIHVENPDHFQELRAEKYNGRRDSTKAWLMNSLVNFSEFIKINQENGQNIGNIVLHMGRLAHKYHPSILDCAIAKAIESGSADMSNVMVYLEFHNEQTSKIEETPPLMLSEKAQQADYISPSDPLAHLKHLGL